MLFSYFVQSRNLNQFLVKGFICTKIVNYSLYKKLQYILYAEQFGIPLKKKLGFLIYLMFFWIKIKESPHFIDIKIYIGYWKIRQELKINPDLAILPTETLQITFSTYINHSAYARTKTKKFVEFIMCKRDKNNRKLSAQRVARSKLHLELSQLKRFR